MRSAWLVAIREYLENAKTKGFWIGIFIVPLLFFLSLKVPRLLEEKAKPTRYFILVDRSGEFEGVVDVGMKAFYEKKVEEARKVWAALQQAGKKQEDFQPPRSLLVRVPVPEGVDASTDETLVAGLRPYLSGEKTITVEGKSGDLFALVLLPPDLGESRTGIQFWCTNLADSELMREVQGSINEELRRREYLRSGVDEREVKRIQSLEVGISGKDPKKKPGEEQVGEIDKWRQWAPVAFVYLLWVGLFTVAQMLLNNTVEEKSSRILEVLLSSVTPWEIMFGKLLGIAAVGLTMLFAWVGSGILLLKWQMSTETKLMGQLLQLILTPELLVAFFVYFVLGFVLYGGIFLALGSLCNTFKEAQNLQTPVMILLMVPLLIMTFIPKDPNGPLAVAFSWVPLYTPFVMMNRAAASPPLADLVGTTVLLAATALFSLWLSGKIFRIGILRTGQPPKLLELLRWVKGTA